MLTLGPDYNRRRQVELVVGTRPALLGVDRRETTVKRVEPIQPLRDDRAVGLDRIAVAALEAVARVVALQERVAGVGVGVEDDRRDLLEPGAGVELLPQPRRRTRRSDQAHVL